MVIVCDYSLPHNNWLLGSGSRKFYRRFGSCTHFIVRSITKLVYLCCAKNVEDSNDQPNQSKRLPKCVLLMPCPYNKRMNIDMKSYGLCFAVRFVVCINALVNFQLELYTVCNVCRCCSMFA